MRIQIIVHAIVHAVIFSLALASPVWASPGSLPPSAPAMETPPENETRQQPVLPPALPRGQMLYENHCMVCHESMAHISARQVVKSLPQLRETVLRWADYLKLPWRREEVEDVVIYLDNQYYQFELN